MLSEETLEPFFRLPSLSFLWKNVFLSKKFSLFSKHLAPTAILSKLHHSKGAYERIMRANKKTRKGRKMRRKSTHDYCRLLKQTEKRTKKAVVKGAFVIPA